MEKKLYLLAGKNFKSAIIDQNNVLFSSKTHESFDKFPKTKKDKSFLETFTLIPSNAIKALKCNQKDSNLLIEYTNESNSEKTLTAEFDSTEKRAILAEDIAAIHSLSKNETEENKNTPLFAKLAVIGITIFITGIEYYIACDIQNGIEYEATGRRAGMKLLMAKIAEILGPIGVIIAGLAVVGYIGYFAYDRYKNPAMVVEYK